MSRIGLDARDAARLADELLASGDSLQSVWRISIIQLLDDYSTQAVREGPAPASRRFELEPPRTASPEVDAALAGLAEYLARRDGWPVPDWALAQDRYSKQWWFVTSLRGMHATALQESPASFRKRGVFITASALERI